MVDVCTCIVSGLSHMWLRLFANECDDDEALAISMWRSGSQTVWRSDGRVVGQSPSSTTTSLIGSSGMSTQLKKRLLWHDFWIWHGGAGAAYVCKSQTIESIHMTHRPTKCGAQSPRSPHPPSPCVPFENAYSHNRLCKFVGQTIKAIEQSKLLNVF